MNKFNPIIPLHIPPVYDSTYKKLAERYDVKARLSFPVMRHKKSVIGQNGGGHSVYLTVFNKSSNAFLTIVLRKSELMRLQKLRNMAVAAVTLESLLSTNNSLHKLIEALWRVYHSNNLQLSQSFSRLIHAVTEQGIVWREMIPSAGLINSLAGAGKFFIRQVKRIETFLPFFDAIRRDMRVRNILSVKPVYGETTHIMQNVRINEPAKLKFLTRYKEISRISSLLFTSGGITPILERIYETMEANSLFYSSSVYRSDRTLYRLTNSLWKVYKSQNLELSRNFTRLINTITEENIAIKHRKNVSEMFTSTQSLSNLVYALRRAFSGNNLQLRHSLISLFKDINEAGQTNIDNSANNTFLLLYRLFLPQKENGGRMDFRHPSVSQPEKPTEFSADKAERLIHQKLESVKPTVKAEALNTETLIRAITDRIKSEQKEEWRYEKLQRGLF